jgi:hypothetical protein
MPLDAARALKLLAELRDIDHAARSRKNITLAEKQRRLAIARELNQFTLDQQRPQGGGADHRQHPRAQVKLKVELLGGPRSIELETDSLAVGGVSCVVSFGPRVGDLLSLRLTPPAPDEPIEVMAEVVWFHPIRSRAGLAFHDLRDEARAVIERLIYSDLVKAPPK